MSQRRIANHLLRIVPILFLVLALVPASAFAQRGPGGPHGGGPPEPGMHLERVLGTLNLSSDQQAAIDKILSARRDAGESDRQDMATARMALMDRIHAETFDEQAIRQAAAAVAAVEAEKAVATAKTLGEIRAVLTAEQRTQLQKALAEHKGMRGPAGP
jgi:Spy/CpxP family protein refolding chaperone